MLGWCVWKQLQKPKICSLFVFQSSSWFHSLPHSSEVEGRILYFSIFSSMASCVSSKCFQSTVLWGQFWYAFIALLLHGNHLKSKIDRDVLSPAPEQSPTDRELKSTVGRRKVKQKCWCWRQLLGASPRSPWGLARCWAQSRCLSPLGPRSHERLLCLCWSHWLSLHPSGPTLPLFGLPTPCSLLSTDI